MHLPRCNTAVLPRELRDLEIPTSSSVAFFLLLVGSAVLPFVSSVAQQIVRLQFEASLVKLVGPTWDTRYVEPHDCRDEHYMLPRNHQ